MILGDTRPASELGLSLLSGTAELLDRVRARVGEHGASSAAFDSWRAELRRALKEAGTFRLLVREESGGLGVSFGEVAYVFFALGYRLGDATLADDIVTFPMLCDAMGPDRDAELTRFQSPAHVAFADPAAAAGVIAEVEPPRIERGYVRGTIEDVAFGPNTCGVSAVVAGPTGSEVRYVDAKLPGVRIEMSPSADESATWVNLHLDVPLTQAPVLLDGPDAEAFVALVRAALLVAASCELSGIGERVGTIATEYAKSRRQFDRPIGSFQAIAHLLADLAVDATSLRRLCISTLESWSPEADGGRSGWVPAAILNCYASRSGLRMVESALQVLGGMGFTEEFELHRYLKRALHLYGRYGPPPVLEQDIGRLALGASPSAGSVAAWPSTS